MPAELKDADSYRVYFESTVGEHLQTELLTPVDGYVTVKITSDVVPEPGNMAAQLVAFGAGEIVGYAPVITGTAKVSIPGGTERLSHSLAAEIALNTAARHSHENKAVLDKFAETDGKPTYDGEALSGGGGAGDFAIKMTVASDDDGNYTVTSCDATVEQIDAAVAAEKRVIVISTDTASGVFWEMPIVQAFQGNSYYFGTFMFGQAILSFAQKISENEARWQFVMTEIEAGSVSYSNAMMPGVSTVEDALNRLVLKSYTKIQGSNMFLGDNTEYRLTDVTTLTLTYPTSNFECWMRLTFAESGNITVTLPADTKYIGTAPNFKNGETWELSFKDKVLAAQKVGEGT